jgi:hypothetical protein
VSGSTPSFVEFDPRAVKWQKYVFWLIRKVWKRDWGLLEILMSGSFGSAKSIVIAHLAVTHCLMHEKAVFLLGRLAKPDLKGTIYKKIIEHIEDELVEGVDYIANTNEAYIKFLKNKSEIISYSWRDGNHKKLRSIEASAGAIEELTENEGKHSEAYKEFKNRVGRLAHVPESFLICATNPDDPGHWVYNYFIDKGYEFKKWVKKFKNSFASFVTSKETPYSNRIVFYSVTTDNPFLHPGYIDSIMSSYGPREIERYIYGKWVPIIGDSVYYSYKPDRSFLKDKEYKVDSRYPISISHDFNIGKGKPMSAAASQYINGVWHTFKTFVIEGISTPQLMEEIGSSGVLDHGCTILIHGDGCGAHRDTRSLTTDYQIIKQYYDSYRTPQGNPVAYSYQVPLKNPPVKARHNIVNGLLCNAKGEVRWFVYKGCGVVNDAFQMTKLVENGNYIEDDSKPYQHIGTALGYAAVRVHQLEEREIRLNNRQVIR